ncbi:unnamed protein product [marine sediment metagenome]|uniref:Phosphoesterase HXTX domain-containing protein n=1 Tax=marine sediment metagenome TaxID=412755 RepID=X0UGM3_9ZZZZ
MTNDETDQQRMIRTFIAIEISDLTRRNLARAQDELKAALQGRGGGIRWVPPENIHVTIKFLGEVPPNIVLEIGGIMTECCDGVAPFALVVRGVGAFPPAGARPPRVVFAAAEIPEELRKIRDCLEEKLALLGIKRERRAFKAHLTLGRVRLRRGPSGRGPRATDELQSIMTRMADRDFGETHVEAVTLMRSDLSPSGAVYTPLHRVSLV